MDKPASKSINHILKFWGKGGVEDYISSLLEFKNSSQRVIVKNGFRALLLSLRAFKGEKVVFHTPSFFISSLLLSIRGIDYCVILHNEPFRGNILKDSYFLFLICFHSFLETKIYVWTNSISNKLKKFGVISEVMPVFNQKSFKEINLNTGKEVVFVGRNDRQKNIPFLKKIAKENPDFSFKVYGDGFEKNYFKNYPNIEYKGFSKDKARIYNASFILITSRYEVGPLVALEALSYGMPVVTTQVGIFKNMDFCDDLGPINVYRDELELNKILQSFRNITKYTTRDNLEYLSKNFITPEKFVYELEKN